VHGLKQAARVFARILEHIESDGITRVADAIGKALDSGTALLTALRPQRATSATALRADDVPRHLRSLEIAWGRAADYDQWLAGGER
jgi:hypothetical protein